MIFLSLVAFYGSLALSAWGLQLAPDVGIYLSGFGLYPSPLGTLFASLLGYWGLAVVHAIGLAFIVVALVSVRPDWKALVISLPVLVWAVPLGVDAVAAACIVWFVVLNYKNFVPLVWGWHLAALPTTVGMFLQNRRTRMYGVFAMLLGIATLLLTPYGSVINLDLSLLFPALVQATCVILLGLSPLLFIKVTERRNELFAFAVGTFVVCFYASLLHVDSGFSFGLSVFATMRYCLPLTLFILVSQVSDGLRDVPKNIATEGANYA